MEKLYPYVRAWYLLHMGCTEQRTRNMLQVANDEEAPESAVYRLMNGSWATLDELQPSERAALQAAVQAKADSYRADLERLAVYEREKANADELERCRMIRQTLEDGLAVWETA